MIANYEGVVGVSKITEFCDVLNELVIGLKLPTDAAPIVHIHLGESTGNPCSRSINNPGNICFMNASLQLLYSINTCKCLF